MNEVNQDGDDVHEGGDEGVQNEGQQHDEVEVTPMGFMHQEMENLDNKEVVRCMCNRR